METISRVSEAYPGRISVSIDKKGNRVLISSGDVSEDPLEVLKTLNNLDLKDIIYLDLDRVGTGKGVDAGFLGEMVSSSSHSLLLGGGVKNMEDIETLADIGLAGALVATAVHNGEIPLKILQKGVVL